MMYSATNIYEPDFQSLPQKYKIQLEVKDHVIAKLQKQLTDQTEELIQTKAMLDVVRDQFLTLLKRIIQNRQKFPQSIMRTKLINDYIYNLSKLSTNTKPKISSNRKDYLLNSSNSNRSFNHMNSSFSSYIENTQRSFAFSNRYNILFDDYLNNLYQKGKYEDNSAWLKNNSSINNNFEKKRNKSSSSFFIRSSPYMTIYKRKNADMENFSSRRSLNQTEIRNLSGRKNKLRVGTAYEDFSNRSFQIRRSNSKGNKYEHANTEVFNTNERRNIHVNMMNQAAGKKIIDYSTPSINKN